MSTWLTIRIISITSLVMLGGCASWLGGDELVESAELSEVTNETEETGEQSASSRLNIVDITTVDGAPYSISRSEQPSGDSNEETDNFGAPIGAASYSSAEGAYKGRPLHKNVGDYVKNMTQDLVSNMDYVTQETPIGVTHFSLLDSDLQHTNLLGKQMAESFIHEIHKFRIPVIDFKTTDYIRVTEQGDFILSRDYLELKHGTGVHYVLTGTLTKHQGGYLVNARIIGMESRAVVATAQTLVPFYVADALIPSHETSMDEWTDGVKLKRGSM